MTPTDFTRMMRLPLLAMLFALAMAACSDDDVVNTGPIEPFKERSCTNYRSYLKTIALVPTPGTALAVDFGIGFAYVADGDNGLQIVDFTDLGDPRNPVLRGATGPPAVDAAVGADNIVCLSAGSDGLVVVDVGDPDRPFVTGRSGTPGSAGGIAVVDTVVYLADDAVGLMLFNISDPSDPRPMGVDNSTGRALDVAVSGSFAYVADGIDGLRVVNVADPDVPWRVDTIDVSGAGLGVDIAGDYVYVSGAGGLHVVDVSDPIASFVAGSSATLGFATGVAVRYDGGAAFVAEGSAGTEVFDVTDPASPVSVNHVVSGSSAAGAAVSGGLVLLAEKSGGLRVIHAPGIDAPPVVAAMPSDAIEKVTLVEAGPGGIFAVGSASGLFSVGAGDSLRPDGTLAMPYAASDIAVGGDSVFVASRNGGVDIIDVTDPAAPAFAAHLPYNGSAVGVAVSDSVVAFATGGRLFGVWTVGDADVVTIQIPFGQTSSVCIAGGYAYAGDAGRSVQVVEIIDPRRPRHLTAVPAEGGVRDVLADGRYLYVVTAFEYLPGTRSGVAVYDLQFPTFPIAAAFMPLSTAPYAVAVSDSTLYVASGNSGIEVFDVTDPGNPFQIGSVPWRDSVTGITVSGSRVFAAGGTAGLFAVPVEGCAPAQ